MPLQQFDLNRAGETPIATLKLNEITPKDWRRYPPPVEDMTPEHVPVVTYTGGEVGDDVDEATANSTDDYAPRTQADKAATLGVPMAVDMGRARGAIEPRQPYPVAGDTPLADPTLTSVTPNTVAAGPSSAAIVVSLIGTGFTPWSTVKTGGVETDYVHYLSPTQINVGLDPRRAVPGVIDIIVTDHDVDTAPVAFTFT